MQLPQPYLYTSPYMMGLVDRAQMVPHEGPLTDIVYGYHTLWIAEVPFIPTFISQTSGDFDIAASNRITHAMQRQIRFLYDLAKSREHLSTFELRLVSWPQAGNIARVGIAFLGKIFHPQEDISRHLALELWNKFSAIFPREAPFSYPLVPVIEGDNGTTGQTHTFSEWYQPLSSANVTRPGCLVELRKYEDWPTIRDVGGTLHARDYIPHPFIAALDYSSMARLFETLARQQKTNIVSITLRPQRITDQEVVILHELAGWYQRVCRGDAKLDNPLIEVLKELKSDVFEAYLGTRAELGKNVYESLVREHRSLFTVRLQVIGDPYVENDLIEALGSEVMANAGSAYPSRWTRVEPDSEEDRQWASFNSQWLEFARWGITPIIQKVPSLIRLRHLATVSEVAGAFRLPIAPRSGGVAGITVRDEPFGLPTNIFSSSHNTHFTMGRLLDRGVPTDLPCMLTTKDISKFTYLFGEASSSRDQVLRSILQGMTKYGIPWALIRKKGASHAGLAAGLPVHYLHIDTQQINSPCPFQAFLPPPGVSLTNFLDALVRIFTAVFQLDASTAIILRQALTDIYTQAGWTGQESTAFRLSELADNLNTALQRHNTNQDLLRALQTRCILPLRDLAISLENICSSAPGQNFRLSAPLIVDIGWIGSDTSQTLIQGCLWSWLALAYSVKDPGAETMIRGVIGIEDAHAIFGQNQYASQILPGFSNVPLASSLPAPTSTLARMLVNTNVGMILLDDRPDLLDREVSHKQGTLLLTHNSNEEALNNVASLIGLSERERDRIRRLTQGETVIVRSGSEPILVTL